MRDADIFRSVLVLLTINNVTANEPFTGVSSCQRGTEARPSWNSVTIGTLGGWSVTLFWYRTAKMRLRWLNN